VDDLSKLKSKQVLIGEIIALLQSPATRVLSALQSGKNQLAGIVQALGKQKAEQA
jgi:large subunit ribosomal protein L10